MCLMSRAGLKLGSIGDTAALVTGVTPPPLNSSGRDNGAGGGLLSGSCLGDVNDGDEDAEAELRELSEEMFSKDEIGEKADLALDCCSIWAC